MIEIRTTITTQTAGLTKRGQNRVFKVLYAEVARMWLNRFFDEHFKTSAFFRYGRTYKKRWTKGKSDRPLFESGLMMQHLKSSARITSTSRKATLTMRGPWYFTAYRRALDKVMELMVMNRRELKQLAAYMARRYPVLVRREKSRRVVRVR